MHTLFFIPLLLTLLTRRNAYAYLYLFKHAFRRAFRTGSAEEALEKTVEIAVESGEVSPAIAGES